MPRPLRRFAFSLGFLALLAIAPQLPAQIVFTVTGSANTSAAGYSIGQPYTFVFTSLTAFADNLDSNFQANTNYWAEENAAEHQIWSSVTSTSLSGSYTRPAGNYTQSFLQVTDSPGLSFGAGSDNGSGANIGLITPNTTLLGTIVVTTSDSPPASLPTFTFPSGFSDPVGYFASRNGTYTGFDTASLIWIYNSGGTPVVSFHVTSLTINATPVPEPAAYAACCGLGALCLAAWRRRRNA